MAVITPQKQGDEVFYPDTDGEPMAESDFQRKPLTYLVEALSHHYRSLEDVYVSGNLLIYYEQGNPRVSVAPDVFVVFDVPKHDRKIYKVWEEGKGPDVVIEITSATTRIRDEVDKPKIYRRLGVREYFQYDPTGDYLKANLRGRYLTKDGKYKPLPLDFYPGKDSCIKSGLLDLVLCADKSEIRLFDPLSSAFLSTYTEAIEAREQAAARIKELEAELKRKR